MDTLLLKVAGLLAELEHEMEAQPGLHPQRVVVERVGAAGRQLEEHAEGMLVRDPSGNGVMLVCKAT
jgi:hypothetical protein